MSLGKPLAAYRLTQGFGVTLVTAEPRMFTSSVKASFARLTGLVDHPHVHPALDMGGNREGTSIIASDDGIVDFAGPAICPGPECGGGLVVEVRVASGWHYLACHCSALAVRVGDRVRRGQTIAYVGSTGNSTGAHVHFQVYQVVSGSRVWWDPRLFFDGGARANDGTFGATLPDTATEADMLVLATVEPFVAAVSRPIGPHEVVNGYDPSVQGKPVDGYTNPLDRGTSVLVDAYVTVSYPDTTNPPIPRGRFLRVSKGGGLEGRLVVMPTAGALTPAPVTQPAPSTGITPAQLQQAEANARAAGIRDASANAAATK